MQKPLRYLRCCLEQVERLTACLWEANLQLRVQETQIWGLVGQLQQAHAVHHHQSIAAKVDAPVINTPTQPELACSEDRWGQQLRALEEGSAHTMISEEDQKPDSQQLKGLAPGNPYNAPRSDGEYTIAAAGNLPDSFSASLRRKLSTPANSKEGMALQVDHPARTSTIVYRVDTAAPGKYCALA